MEDIDLQSYLGINMIKKVKFFYNKSDRTKEILSLAIKEFEENGFQVVDTDYDLAIAIGGDGSFLHMLKDTSFNSDVYYVGINAGTLGFLQEIKPEEIPDFINKIKKKKYKVETIGIQETTVISSLSNKKYYSLNEIVVREKNLNTAVIEVKVDDDLLEKFVGDGIMVATSVGSSAYNLSFGGSIVYGTLPTLQITPIAPLNSKAYRDLLNSVIVPENNIITLIPDKEKNNLLITIDGDNIEFEHVDKIITVVNNKKINCLRLENYSFIKIVNEKFLK